MRRFKNILLLHDGRSEQHLTMKRGVDLAWRNQAKLTVVDVIEEDSWVSGEIYGLEPFQELKQLISEDRQKELDIVIEPLRQQGLDVRAKLLFGKPFLEMNYYCTYKIGIAGLLLEAQMKFS